MAINAISPLMERRIKEACGEALESFHIERGCCCREESPSCLWVYLKKGWVFDEMQCGSLHESSAKAAYRVLAGVRKANEGEG